MNNGRHKLFCNAQDKNQKDAFYRQFIASSEIYLQSAVLSLMINRNLIEKSWIREFKHRLKLHWKYDECKIMSISLKSKSC